MAQTVRRGCCAHPLPYQGPDQRFGRVKRPLKQLSIDVASCWVILVDAPVHRDRLLGSHRPEDDPAREAGRVLLVVPGKLTAVSRNRRSDVNGAIFIVIKCICEFLFPAQISRRLSVLSLDASVVFDGLRFLGNYFK